jgi:hypothetical protein
MSFQQAGLDAYLDKTVTVKNLTDQQLNSRWGGQPFVLGPQAEEQVPMWLAKHLVRKFDQVEVHGRVEKWIEVIENVNFTCGTCQKSFEDRRQLGAHSLSHRSKE